MNKFFTVYGLTLMAVLTMIFTGCQEKDTNHRPVDNPPKPTEKMSGNDSDFIGLDEKQAQGLAEDRGLPSRVVEVDGESRPVTKDYNLGRINFSIENGKVIKTQRG